MGHAWVSDAGLLAAQRLDCLPIQIQRSGHRGPPPRHPGVGSFRRVFSVGNTSGFPDPGLWAAQQLDSLPIQTQRSGHGGPPPRHPGAGPLRMVFSVGCTSGVSDPGFLAAHWHDSLPIPAQRSGHGGPRGRGPREFIDPKGTAGSASARHSPRPFPEGEIFHSLGLTRSGYPR